MLRYGFEQLDLNRILARYFSENLQSGRVMEKLGMKYEGRVRHTRNSRVPVNADQSVESKS